jgi:hypothetical protein
MVPDTEHGARTQDSSVLSSPEDIRRIPGPLHPIVAHWHADFRAVDSEHCARCLRDKLCAICGRRLGEYCYFIGGPLSKKNRLFVGPAMHKQCAEFASQTCPFLSGQKLEYSNRPAEHKDALLTKVPMALRPDTMFIMRTYTKKIRAVTVDGKAMIQAGQWNGVNVFGRS